MKQLNKFSFLLFVILTTNFSAQNILNSNLKSECFTNNNYLNKSIKILKEDLTLKLEITKIKIDDLVKKMSFQYTEKIKNESSLIIINDSIAFKISIGRVVDQKLNKYLYKADLYRKIEDCWQVATPTNYWNEFSLGVISSGLGFGYEGTLGYLGFDGTLIVE